MGGLEGGEESMGGEGVSTPDRGTARAKGGVRMGLCLGAGQGDKTSLFLTFKH